MGRSLIYILIVFLTVPLFGLEYIESSSGLDNPAMEGGRTEMEFADINGDGDVDILSIGDHGSPYVSTDEHGVMVWFGDGNGNWSVYQNGDFGYGGIAVGDVNNDGHLDIGYAMHHTYSSTDFGDQFIEVALGDGTGMNWTPWDDGLATNGETWGMFCTDFADIDNDGYLDIGSNSFGCCAGVHIYLNRGDGSWVQSCGFLGGNSREDFTFGEINNDGNVDFAVGQEYGTVYFGDGEGSFSLNDVNLPSPEGLGLRGTALGDVNNDGGRDLSFINDNGGIEIRVWDEEQGLWLDFSGNLPTSGSYDATQLYDMSVDGYIDVAAFGNGTFTLWLGDGTGNWTQDAQFSTPSPGDCKAFRVGGDIDHNGFPDIVFVAKEGTWPAYHNHLYCFKESSTADSLSLTPVFPKGSEKFTQYSAQFIDWTSAVPNGDSSFVKLEYSICGSTGPWTTIADSLPNDGHCQWTVPEVNSQECYIRYKAWTATDTVMATTPQAFTILGEVGVDDIYTGNERILLWNYSNPFGLKTIIEYSLPKPANISLKIYDVNGKVIETLLDEEYRPRGRNSIIWEPGNLCSGIYFYRLSTKDYTEAGKCILLK